MFLREILIFYLWAETLHPSPAGFILEHWQGVCRGGMTVNKQVQSCHTTTLYSAILTDM